MQSPSIIRDLLEIGAVKIETEDYYTWTSGLKSPIYCDNRLTMSYPTIRKNIAKAFVKRIEALDQEVDVIAGCATAGIPHAAWVADLMNLPMVYVRSSAKKHGKGNQIEGHIEKGQKAVVIEDLISTGKSSIEAADALQQEGVEVIKVISIFTYDLSQAKESFRDKNYSYQALTSYEELIHQLVEDHQLEAKEEIKLREWRENPYIFTKT
ncbi:orotate phosphoribosyltransferase [Halobacillus karajensis]|uniref:Orotate phosphoribosyltransferase n=1 Tax=Halobacillus karajensis TaxID=195088 RepID=A0A024P3R8_9BACI|nr:orotate phosphoribosyltransferase [Halobacillus karajensis]CDQ19812.1 Orotate phosphoribosyltransferase [Halobacillus karajensis]CDQ22272.1 Orotate phosphoribosyltransferase [Halobacillus karajensis]CDQ28113.1 Orotate phosphoribosyltransferase [Halobacillus karajensis]SEH71746.1 orotate phosphoribosyltransferase [Halobacillus karajensis]